MRVVTLWYAGLVQALMAATLLAGPFQSVNDGDVTFGSTSTTLFEIGGYTPGAGPPGDVNNGYDQFLIGGTATLGGTFNLQLINSFVPSGASTFDLIIAGNIVNNGVGYGGPNISSFTISLIDGVSQDILRATALGAPPGDRYYVGPDNGSWNIAANWSATDGGAGGASVPAPNDNAFVTGSVSKTVNLDTTYSSPLSNLRVDGSGGAQMTVSQTSASSAMHAHNQWIGIDGQGRYVQSAGTNTIDTSLANDGFLSIGHNAGSVGTYDMSGGTLNITSGRFAGAFEVGRSGNGTLNLSGGTVNVNASTTIGAGAGGMGTVNQTSGSMTITTPLVIMGFDPGATGNYNISGASSNLTVNGVLVVGREGSGTFTHSAGTVNVAGPGNSGLVYLAAESGSTGSYTINDGTLTANSVVVGGAIADPGGTGTLTVNGGNVNAGLLVWDDGTVNLNSGGTINVGTDPQADNIRNEGVINNNGGTLIMGGRMYSVSGNGVVNSAAGTVSLADGTKIDSGAFNQSGGTTTSSGDVTLATSAGSVATFTQTGGDTTINGTLGVGNDGTLTGGTGNGQVNISGGNLNADTIILGSSAGGDGHMTISGTANVTVGGGMTYNQLTVNGGSLTVLDQAPPAGEDPVLDRSIVGGYLRDGAMHMNGGVVSTPKLKIGIDKIGTYIQNGGTMTVQNLLAVNGANSVITFNGGTINTASSNVNGVSALVVGDGTKLARLNLTGNGTHTFVDNMVISTTGRLGGTGTIEGDVTSHGTIAPGDSPGTLTITGNLTMTSTNLLDMELGGTVQGTQYDFLHVLGNTSVDGTLKVTFINGYQATPFGPEVFTIVTSDGTLSGAFSNVASGNRLNTADGLGSFLVTYNDGNNVMLSNYLPEPSGFVVAGLVLGMICMRRKRD